MTTKFNVGDRVRVAADAHWLDVEPYGFAQPVIGTISSLPDIEGDYSIALDTPTYSTRLASETSYIHAMPQFITLLDTQEPEQPGVWCYHLPYSTLIPFGSELDALRHLNHNADPAAGTPRVIYVPFGTDPDTID